MPSCTSSLLTINVGPPAPAASYESIDATILSPPIDIPLIESPSTGVNVPAGNTIS